MYTDTKGRIALNNNDILKIVLSLTNSGPSDLLCRDLKIYQPAKWLDT